MNELIELLIEQRGHDPNPQKGREIVGNIVLQMRKDLLGKSNLKTNDFRYTDVLE